MPRDHIDDHRANQGRLTNRTEHLRFASTILYWIEHYSSLPGVAIAVMIVVICLVGTVVGLSFPTRLVAAFEVSVSAITLLMVFAIQHTQGREQAATQRKLDELLRTLPGANDSLVRLEEASSDVLLDAEDGHSDTRAESTMDKAPARRALPPAADDTAALRVSATTPIGPHGCFDQCPTS